MERIIIAIAIGVGVTVLAFFPSFVTEWLYRDGVTPERWKRVVIRVFWVNTIVIFTLILGAAFTVMEISSNPFGIWPH